MRTVLLAPGLADRLRTESRRGYPDEVCGFLLTGSDEADGPLRRVRAVEPAPNSFAGERRRRFVISAEELQLAERRAEDRGKVVVGFYHSHPDHPAAPSEFDTEHAWPWYTYLVLSVDRHGAGKIGAFELEAATRRFRNCPFELAEPPAAVAPVLVPGGR